MRESHTPTPEEAGEASADQVVTPGIEAQLQTLADWKVKQHAALGLERHDAAVRAADARQQLEGLTAREAIDQVLDPNAIFSADANELSAPGDAGSPSESEPPSEPSEEPPTPAHQPEAPPETSWQDKVANAASGRYLHAAASTRLAEARNRRDDLAPDEQARKRRLRKGVGGAAAVTGAVVAAYALNKLHLAPPGLNSTMRPGPSNGKSLNPGTLADPQGQANLQANLLDKFKNWIGKRRDRRNQSDRQKQE